MLEKMKKQVCEANLLLPRYGLVKFTWGNVSAVDREKGLVVIKPSGIEYDDMTADDMVVVDFDGNVVESIEGIKNKWKPSSDTATHIHLYRSFPDIGAVVHTHSTWATIMSQIGIDIQPYGTTHADYFAGAVPCTRDMTADEISKQYELNTGKVVSELFNMANINPNHIPAVLVKNHGPFTWGNSPEKAVENAAVLEEVAFMAYHTMHYTNVSMPKTLLDKHFYRKHGDGAYYGQ